MLRKPTKPFGSMLRQLRQREGLSQIEVALHLIYQAHQRKLPEYMIVDREKIERIETGSARPPHHLEFYEDLAVVPGVSESDTTLLREAAQYELAWWLQDTPRSEDTNRTPRFFDDVLHRRLEQPHVPEIVQEYRKLSYWSYFRSTTPDFDTFTYDARRLIAEEASKNLTESLQRDDRIPVLDPEKGADSTQYCLQTENPLPIHYSHTSVPDHAPQLVKEGKWKQVPKKGTVFDRGDAKLFFEALENPNHQYNLQAEAALQGFTKAAEKSRVTTLNKVSSEYHIPIKNLSEWVAKGLIPYESRDKNAIYLSKEIAQEVARDVQESKEMGVQTARLLRERQEKYFPSVSNKQNLSSK